MSYLTQGANAGNFMSPNTFSPRKFASQNTQSIVDCRGECDVRFINSSVLPAMHLGVNTGEPLTHKVFRESYDNIMSTVSSPSREVRIEGV